MTPFERIVRASARRPGRVLAVAFAALALLRLEPSAATDTLVGRSTSSWQATERYRERFGEQSVIVLIGVGTLALLLWEPHLEGRNAHATPFEIYFKDPFLAYAYVASIPFFAALFQAFKVLGYTRQNKVFSPAAGASGRGRRSSRSATSTSRRPWPSCSGRR